MTDQDESAAALEIVLAATGIPEAGVRSSRIRRCVHARWAWWTILRRKGYTHARIAEATGHKRAAVAYGLDRATRCQDVRAIVAKIEGER